MDHEKHIDERFMRTLKLLTTNLETIISDDSKSTTKEPGVMILEDKTGHPRGEVDATNCHCSLKAATISISVPPRSPRHPLDQRLTA